MRNLYLLGFIICLALCSNLNAQLLSPQLGDNTNLKKCATVEVQELYAKAHPGTETTQQFEAWLDQKIKQRKANQIAGKITPGVVIPVVFHIIHNNTAVGSPTNVSQALIQQQVLQLNKDFANLSNSPYGVAEDMGIQFALAGEDPNGVALAEPGIDRINRIDKGWTAPPYTVGYASAANNYLTNTIKPNSTWDATRYLNIWVADYEAGILGIATFPASSTLTGLNNSETLATAGVSISYITVGSVFTPQGCGAYGKGRTLTHELGHFFGLRHIWGDGTCATDYCNDTPTHQTSNSGVPTHPKPNACGTADEMFENYMDYSDDIVANTFTVNQGDRMETVFANSPRRASLASSTVTKVPVTASNRISFNDCSGILNTSEAGAAGTTQRYRDINLYINVEDKATDFATVTFTTGGTAVLNKNYQLLTPTLSFSAGETFKSVGLRIIDNAEADGDKTIVLSYSISGAGVTAGSAAQTMTINIADDDNVIIGQNAFNIIDESFAGGTIPSGWTSLLTGGSPNSFTVSTNGDAGGSGAAAHITNDAVAKPNTYTNTFNGVAILRSPQINPLSVKSFGNLNFKYKIRGRVNSDFGYTLFTIPNSTSLFFWGTTSGLTGYGPYASNTATLANSPSLAFPTNVGLSKFQLNYYFACSGTAVGVNPGFNVDDITLSANPFPIESTVTSSYGFDVATGNTNQNTFRSSANNNIVAAISNSSTALTGVQASVIAAGTTRTAFTTNATGGFRTDKVVRIKPTTPNTTASYTVTLYFTAAELAVWGAEIPTLKILKLDEGVYSTNNYTSANSSLLPTTFSDQSAKGYYTYTGTVSGTGFSDFVVVSSTVVLPVTLLDFAATAEKSSVKLSWSTSQEINNKGFAIERSIDGINYTKIGWVDGRMNSSLRSDYTFIDNFVSPKVVYFYRLRQTDADMREKISVVRQAKIEQGDVIITLSPNPTKGQVNLFIGAPSKLVNVKMTNAEGRTIKAWKVNNGLSMNNLNISGIAAGLYTFSIEMDGQTVIKKLVVL